MAVPAAPAAGAGIEGIAGLFLIVGFLVLLGMQRAWRASIGWLFLKLADLLDVDIGLPHLGSIHPFGFAANALRAASHNVDAGLGYAALKLEHSAVWLFHQAAQQLRWVGHEIAALATETWQGLNDLIEHEIPAAVHAGTRPLLHRIHGIDRTLSRLDHFAHEQLHRLRVGIDRLTHTVTKTIPAEIAATNARVGATARQLRRLARRTRALEKDLAPAAFAAATAAALSRLGLRWLRCPALGRVGRKVGCGGFSFLELLLADTLDVLLIRDLCRMVGAIERLAIAFEGELLALVDELEGFICGGTAVVPSGIVPADLKRVAKHPTGLTAYDLKPPSARKLAA